MAWMRDLTEVDSYAEAFWASVPDAFRVDADEMAMAISSIRDLLGSTETRLLQTAIVNVKEARARHATHDRKCACRAALTVALRYWEQRFVVPLVRSENELHRAIGGRLAELSPRGRVKRSWLEAKALLPLVEEGLPVSSHLASAIDYLGACLVLSIGGGHSVADLDNALPAFRGWRASRQAALAA